MEWKSFSSSLQGFQGPLDYLRHDLGDPSNRPSAG